MMDYFIRFVNAFDQNSFIKEQVDRFAEMTKHCGIYLSRTPHFPNFVLYADLAGKTIVAGEALTKYERCFHVHTL